MKAYINNSNLIFYFIINFKQNNNVSKINTYVFTFKNLCFKVGMGNVRYAGRQSESDWPPDVF